MSRVVIALRDHAEAVVKPVASWRMDGETYSALVGLELRAKRLQVTLNLTPAEAVALSQALLKAANDASAMPLQELGPDGRPLPAAEVAP